MDLTGLMVQLVYAPTPRVVNGHPLHWRVVEYWPDGEMKESYLSVRLELVNWPGPFGFNDQVCANVLDHAWRLADEHVWLTGKIIKLVPLPGRGWEIYFGA